MTGAIRLDSVCTITMGQAPVGESYNDVGDGLPLIAGAGDFDGVLPAAKKFTSAPGKVCQRGDIVLGIRASIGEKVVADGPYCLGRGVAGLRPMDTLSSRYLWHWLTHAMPVLRAKAKGATFVQVNREDIAELLIALPLLGEQHRIAAILDKADELRTKRRSAIAQVDTLAQSIFLEMFGDPATNPKGFARVTVDTLLAGAEVFDDGDWVESKDQDPAGDVRLIQLADVGDGKYIDKSARFLNKTTAVRLRCTFLKPWDVLIARMPDPLGRACLFPGDEREAVTVVDVCIVRPNRSSVEPAWLMSCINSSGFRHAIAREATGTTRERISRGNLRRLEIIAPPIQLQRTFAARIQALDGIQADHRSSLAELETLFASLQHRAFRGEVQG